MDDAVLKVKFDEYDRQIKELEKHNKELEQKIAKLECKAGFARAAELERIEKEREEELKEAGITKEEFLEQSKAHKPTSDEIIEGVASLTAQIKDYSDTGKISDKESNRLKGEIGEHAMKSLARIDIEADVLEETTNTLVRMLDVEKDTLLDIYKETCSVEVSEEEEEEEGAWFDNKKEKAWFE